VANIYTQLPQNQPGYYGEFLVGEKLKEIDDKDLDLWFNLDYLPSVPELDLVLAHPRVGMFLIEIKGLTIDSIQTYNLQDLILFPNVKKQHPVEQVRTGQIRLKNFLKDAMKLQRGALARVPFIHTTIIWPQISRREWNDRFTNIQLKMQSDSMLFKDDLNSKKALLEKLKYFTYKPLLGVSPQNKAEPDQIGNVKSFLMPRVLPQINQSLEQEVKRPVIYSKELAIQFPPPKQYNVLLEGPPGTGKSTVLREIGLLHASAGGTVLHVCYNKVLAADQRREYKLLQRRDVEYGVIEVFDEWELYKAIHPDWQPYAGEGLSGRFKVAGELVEEIIRAFSQTDSHPKEVYDTILIDEAQDLSEGIFKLLKHLARPTASWFVSYGHGQEIYNFNAQNPSPWLANWMKTAERRVLRRSFRNSTRSFLISQGFWENFPNSEKLLSWLESKKSDKKSDSSTPELELALPSNSNDFRITRISREEGRKESICEILLEAIEESRRANRGEDILIVVSDTRSGKDIKTNYELISEIIEELQGELNLSVLDLVPREKRRETPVAETIRIAKYQNVRGLSASHVILFDLDSLEKWCEESVVESRGQLKNYGYIALSRSRASTLVVMDSTDDSKMGKFIQYSINLLLNLSLRP
jgi:nucleoside-triphosphatase THEP1